MFERALVYKVAAFIQLANFFFVIFPVVERQTPTVIYTRAVAMNWVYRWKLVKNMINKLWVLYSISVDIEGISLTLSFFAMVISCDKLQEHDKL